MKKIMLALLLGLLLLTGPLGAGPVTTSLGKVEIVARATAEPSSNYSGSINQGEFRNVNCAAGVNGCQIPDDMLGGALQPAVSFTVAADQVVHLVANVWPTADCSGPEVDGSPVMGDLPLMAGPVVVFLRFDPPLETGTTLSIKWTIDNCPQTACITYVMGPDGTPPICGGVDKSESRDCPVCSEDQVCTATAEMVGDDRIFRGFQCGPPPMPPPPAPVCFLSGVLIDHRTGRILAVRCTHRPPFCPAATPRCLPKLTPIPPPPPGLFRLTCECQ